MARFLKSSALLLCLLVAMAYAGTAAARPMPRTIVSRTAAAPCQHAAAAAAACPRLPGQQADLPNNCSRDFSHTPGILPCATLSPRSSQTITIPDPAAVREAISTSELAEFLASHLQQPGAATALLSSQVSELLNQSKALGRKGLIGEAGKGL